MVTRKDNDLSSCCNAMIRDLKCEECRTAGKQCIDVCTECGATIEYTSEAEAEGESDK